MGLVAQAVQGRTDDVVFVHAPGQTDDSTPGVLIPVGRTQTGEGGHHIASVGIGNFFGHILGICRGIDEFQLIPEPLNRRTGHEDGALQRVVHLSVQTPGDGGHQSVLAVHGLLAGIHQQETTGAVGILCLAGAEALLSEEGGLLIAGGTGDGDGGTEEFGQGMAVNFTAGSGLREHSGGDVQFGENFLVPAQGIDIEEHGPAGVGVVGHMDLATGELPDQPGLHGAEEQIAPLCFFPCAGDIFQNPAELGAGEIGIDHEACFLPDGVGEAFRLQGITIFAGPAALPHDGVAHGLAGGFVPDDGGFPLVGDADGGDVRGVGADDGHGLFRHLQLGGEDLVCVVFHPAGPGEDLGEFLLSHGADFAGVVEQNAPVGCGSGIQGHDVFGHRDSSSLVLAVSLPRQRVFCNLCSKKTQAHPGVKRRGNGNNVTNKEDSPIDLVGNQCYAVGTESTY